MVSFRSLFSKKKKSKRTPSPPPPLASPPTSRPTQTRFLSLRSKSRPYDLEKRRANFDLQRKRSQKGAEKSNGDDIPKLALDFGWEVRADQGLGLDDVGRLPRLSETEVRVLESQKWNCHEVAKGWEVFGQALRDTGMETPGTMLPQSGAVDRSVQYRLLALFNLVVRPSLTDAFPSLTSYYPAMIPEASTDGVWLSRLKIALKDITDPSDLTEILTFVLHRLTASTRSSSATPGTTKNQAVLDATTYKQFVRAEHAASYPLDAYHSLLLPTTEPGISAVLSEVLEVFAGIAAKGDVNMMGDGRICLILGWWIMGQETEGPRSWEEMYAAWQTAGSQFEHLFYAWIRYQSTRQTLPGKLWQLVEDYPFGKATLSSEHLPSSPPSSFTRRTLLVTIAAQSSSSRKISPNDILQAALNADDDDSSGHPLWTSLKATREGSRGKQEDRLLARASVAFLAAIPSPSEGVSSSPPETLHRRRSQLYTDLRPVNTDSSHQRPSEAPSSNKQTSASLSKPTRSATWDSFTQSGFAVDDQPDLSLSPRPADDGMALRPVTNTATARRPEHHERDNRGITAYTITAEKVIDVDDAFLAFTEDGQADTSATTSWPRFALLRLASPLIYEGSSPIEWLLITVNHQSPPPSTEHIPRSSSFGASSTTSKLGSSFNLFRRSSSSNALKAGPRRSIFSGSVRPAPKSSTRNSNLTPLSETVPVLPEVGPVSAISATDTEYTITGMGEMVKIGRPVMDIATETKAEDWTYRMEGGAHLLFAYQGSSTAYRHRMLRIRKGNPAHASLDPDIKVKWNEEFLPRLLPPKMLVMAADVRLERDWLRSLFEMNEGKRPENRMLAGRMVDMVHEPLKCSIMEDLNAVKATEDETIVCIELKPKWAFLPSAEYISPPEAVPIKSRVSRFTMHQYLRHGGAEDSSMHGYNPLDLVSGDKARVRKAVDGLWTTWDASGGKINNWRIFVNGEFVLPVQSERIPQVQGDSISSRTAPFIVPALLSTDVFSILSRLQSTLDATDISDLALRYSTVHPDDKLFNPMSVPEPTLAELRAFVDKYCADPTGGRREGWTLRERMIAYSLSAIFKDCSVSIRIPLFRSRDTWQLKGNPVVKVIDLDLKSMSSMQKWAELDEVIWRNWLGTHPTEFSATTQVTTDQKTRSARTGTVTSPSSPAAEFASALAIPPPTAGGSGPSIPVTPAHDEALASDDLSFEDALMISPSSATIGARRSSDPLSLGDALVSTPVNTRFDMGRLSMDHGASTELQDLQEEVEKPASPAQRRDRSTAPSPSPHPEQAKEVDLVAGYNGADGGTQRDVTPQIADTTLQARVGLSVDKLPRTGYPETERQANSGIDTDRFDTPSRTVGTGTGISLSSGSADFAPALKDSSSGITADLSGVDEVTPPQSITRLSRLGVLEDGTIGDSLAVDASGDEGRAPEASLDHHIQTSPSPPRQPSLSETTGTSGIDAAPSDVIGPLDPDAPDSIPVREEDALLITREYLARGGLITPQESAAGDVPNEDAPGSTHPSTMVRLEAPLAADTSRQP